LSSARPSPPAASLANTKMSMRLLSLLPCTSKKLGFQRGRVAQRASRARSARPRSASGRRAPAWRSRVPAPAAKSAAARSPPAPCRTARRWA
jgi:hypothetical protein